MKNLYLEKILRSPVEDNAGTNPDSTQTTPPTTPPTTPRDQIVPLRPSYNGQHPNAPSVHRPILPVGNVSNLNLGGSGR